MTQKAELRTIEDTEGLFVPFTPEVCKIADIYIIEKVSTLTLMELSPRGKQTRTTVTRFIRSKTETETENYERKSLSAWLYLRRYVVPSSIHQYEPPFLSFFPLWAPGRPPSRRWSVQSHEKEVRLAPYDQQHQQYIRRLPFLCTVSSIRRRIR